MSALVCYASLNQRPRKMCNCAILDVTVKQILITAFLKKLPFLAKGLRESGQFECWDGDGKRKELGGYDGNEKGRFVVCVRD